MSTRKGSSESPLGSIQLLGMFLIAVVFFAAALIGGFLAGYQRGIVDQALAASNDQVIETGVAGIPLLQTLPGERPNAAREPADQKEAAKPLTPAARPVSARGGDRPTALPLRTATPTGSAAIAEPSDPTGAGARAESNPKACYLQASAGPELEGAKGLADKLAAKGYPAVVYSGGSDGLHRVIVGPYDKRSRAEADQARLRADGFDSLLRSR